MTTYTLFACTLTHSSTQNRYQDKPEIYKQFLEILQTYQRESKPIQEVYAQVTSLFNAAPDLPEDFKQFLPESAASNKNGARADDMLAMSGLTQTTPQPGHKLQPQPNPSTTVVDSPALATRSIPPVGPATKRAKLNHKPLPTDAPTIEPTLTPVLPSPLPPTSSANATQEEIGFFDKVKKYIGNRSTMNEFLKLCNMYSQSLIDTNDLVHKASQFIGGNPELMNFFKTFVGYEGLEELIENRPRPPSGKVSLSNCRGIGPSYRLLPRRVGLLFKLWKIKIIINTSTYRKSSSLAVAGTRCAMQFSTMNGLLTQPGHLKTRALSLTVKMHLKRAFTVSRRKGMTMISISRRIPSVSNSSSPLPNRC